MKPVRFYVRQRCHDRPFRIVYEVVDGRHAVVISEGANKQAALDAAREANERRSDEP